MIMNTFKIVKSRRSVLRHANMAAEQACASMTVDERNVNSDGRDEHDTMYYATITDNEIDGEGRNIGLPCDSKHSVAISLYECVGDFEDVKDVVGYEDSYLNVQLGSRWLDDSDFSCESDDESEESTENTLAQDLAEWAVSNNTPHSSISGILTVLRKHNISNIPQDPRTLLRTPKNYVVRSVGGGHYSHVGFSKGLCKIVENEKSGIKHLSLQINIDGIPLFKSASTSLWPILCSVVNSVFKEPFVVGLFCGKEKPNSAKDFLKEFVAEACELLADGLTVNGQRIPVSIHSFVMDAPARSFVKGTKSHAGYSSCEKCTVVGEYCGKVVFPISASSKLRSDEDFNNRTDEDHHVTECPLNPLPIGFVSMFGLDFMHLVCLGVMKRFLLYWKGPVGPLHARLGRRAVCDLSTRLMFLSNYVPVEFARKPRTLDDLARWKATEFREFILYSGVLVLQGILQDHFYEHFLLLFTGIRILASQKLAQDHSTYANELLTKFVKDAEVLYGKDSIVYNVHNLVHLAADVDKLGPLDNFSAFKFENKLGQIKKFVRKPQQPIQQVLKRLDEQASISTKKPESPNSSLITKFEHRSGPLLSHMASVGIRQFKHVQCAKWKISTKNGDNCILTDNGNPLLVKNIVKTKDEKIVLLCSRFHIVTDAFMVPLPSTRLSIFKVQNESNDLHSISLTSADTVCKCVCWPVNFDTSSHLIIPMLH